MSSKWIPALFETCPGGVSSAVAPELLPPGQFAWGMNIAVRGGKPHTRPPIVERLVLPSGLHQSSAYFGVQNGMIVSNIQGRIYRLRIGANTFSWEEIPLGFINSGTIKQSWMQQTIESLVIQDGQSDAIIYNGSISRRAAANEVPRGRQMAYGNGRLWVAINQKELVAGDIRTRTAGSELKFTETNYLSGGGSLYFPRGITGLEFIPITGAADFGTLMVFGRDYAESIRADVTSRDMWAQMPGFVTNVFRDIGCSGDWSIAQVNQDLYWRDSNGNIRSLANAISTNNSPGSTPISREVQRIVDYDSDQLLPWVSAIYFDNRLLMTGSPYLNVNTGVSFKDIISLDFSPISTMQLKAAPAYDGTWTGIPGVAQLVTGQFDGVNRAFAISSGEDGVNRLWEILTDGRDDIALSCGSGAVVSRVESLVEYPSINFGLQKNRKRIERCDVWLSGVDGTLDVDVFWRTDNSQKWSEWDEVETCAKTTDAAVIAPHVWKNLLPEQRPQVKTFTIPDGVDGVTKYGLQVGFEFQIRLVVTGKCQLEKVMIYATPVDDPDYANRETLVQECIENDVSGNEIIYQIPACSQGEPPCSPDFTFECRTKTGEATLIGYDEFVDPSTPPRKYRHRTLYSRNDAIYYTGMGNCLGTPIDSWCIVQGEFTYDAITGVRTGGATAVCSYGVQPDPTEIGPFNTSCGIIATTTQTLSTTEADTITCCNDGTRDFHITSSDGTCSQDQEDTEDDAIARMQLAEDWTPWSEGTECLAGQEARTTGFSFDVTLAQFRVTASGILPGMIMTARVPIYRSVAGLGEFELYATLVFEDSANGFGDAQITGDVPNAAGYDSFAGLPEVTAQRCA
jgi:hypothetical protein